MLTSIRVPPLEVLGKKRENLVNLQRTTKTDRNDKKEKMRELMMISIIIMGYLKQLMFADEVKYFSLKNV